jgi:hypothetical protein
MAEQPKNLRLHDLLAAVSLAIMFAGAFILPITPIGFILIGGGGLAMAVLIVSIVWTRN